jgi:hypothetical protein
LITKVDNTELGLIEIAAEYLIVKILKALSTDEPIFIDF